MKFSRIWATFLRYFYFFAKLDQLYDLFYWPAVDIILWGMTSLWIQTGDTKIPDIALAILTGLVFWHIIWRSNYEVTVNLLQEFWNRNMVNIFSTPLKLSEWMCATMLIGLLKAAISLFFGGLVVWFFYTLNIFNLGWAFLPFCASLTLSGWFIGFLSASIMVYYGQRVQMIAWITPYVFAPFCAVFYPVSVLPKWAAMIASCMPMTYIFEGMRKVLFQHEFSYYMLFMSLGLNLVYLILSMALFKFMFEKSRTKGLARLE